MKTLILQQTITNTLRFTNFYKVFTTFWDFGQSFAMFEVFFSGFTKFGQSFANLQSFLTQFWILTKVWTKFGEITTS